MKKVWFDAQAPPTPHWGLGHALISSCRWIRPLLRSRKSTCASLYLVMTSTNLRDRTECWGQGQGREDGDGEFGMGTPPRV